MAIWMQGNESNIDVVLPALNVGNTELFQQVWYHVAVVCKRAKLQELLGTLNKKSTKGNFVINNLRMSGKEMMGKTSDSIFASKSKITAKATRQNNMEATDFAVYLNGVTDGKLSLDGAPSLDTATCCIGSAIDMSMTSCFAGEIKNIQIFDQALSDDEIYSIAHKKGNYSLQKTVLLSYIPSSLKVEIPICNVKYNGPIHRELPTYLQWQPSKQSFTISAWIMCVRSVSKMGSVIVSNLTVNNKGNNIGFELICPTTGNGVIGMQCTGLKENGVLSLGTTSIEKNRFYHIAIIIERVITYGAKPDATSIVVFINGKQDGSFNINHVFDYSGRAWSIGYNNKYKKESRFEGSISNLRIFKRALVEAEIACIYATDTRERKFDKNEEILYYIENQFNNNNSNNLQWVKGIYLSSNISDGEITIYDSGKNKKTITMNEIIKLENKISKFIPATDSEMITNLGGMIHGKDFDGNKWRIYSSETKFLRHITSPSCFTLLSQLKPFPKHTFELMINNKSINNKYILNRLLNSAHELLKSINKNSKLLWTYFNEYILPWNGIWGNEKNFKLLQKYQASTDISTKNPYDGCNGTLDILCISAYRIINVIYVYHNFKQSSKCDFFTSVQDLMNHHNYKGTYSVNNLLFDYIHMISVHGHDERYMSKIYKNITSLNKATYNHCNIYNLNNNRMFNLVHTIYRQLTDLANLQRQNAYYRLNDDIKHTEHDERIDWIKNTLNITRSSVSMQLQHQKGDMHSKQLDIHELVQSKYLAKYSCSPDNPELCLSKFKLVDILNIYRKFKQPRKLQDIQRYNVIDLILSFLYKHYSVVSYGIENLHSDYRHILSDHDDIYRQNMLKMLVERNGPCNTEICGSIDHKKTDNPFGLKSPRHIQFIIELDIIHRELEHPLQIKQNKLQSAQLNNILYECGDKYILVNQYKQQMKQKTSFVNDSESDGDEKYQSNNIHTFRNNNSTKFISNNIYDKSKRFYYWDAYKNDDRSDLKNGGTFSDWYIAPRYGKFKDEIFELTYDDEKMDTNEKSQQGMRIWYEVVKNVKKLQSKRSKWAKRGFIELSARYNLQNVEFITDRHLISLKIYTDYTGICRKFAESFRLRSNETMNDLKKRHSAYFYLAKNIREAVECFGREITEKNQFYRGIEKEMYFANPILTFNGPLSCTSESAQARCFAGDKGMVIALKKYYQRLTYFDCSVISRHPAEQEKLFIGGLGCLRISDVFTSNAVSLRKYITAITWTKNIIEAKLPSVKINNEKSVKIFKTLMNVETNNEEKESDNIPEYATKLFEYFRSSKDDTLIIDFDLITTSYSKLKNEFVNPMNNWIHLVKIMKLFNNVRILELKHSYL
eukprot:22533_1